MNSNESIHFAPSPRRSVGVEIELWVNDEQGRLVNGARHLIDTLNDEKVYKPELFQSIVEVNSDVAMNAQEAVQDLSTKIQKLVRCAKEKNWSISSSGTHPISKWREVPIDNSERYQGFLSSMGWPARRLLICGTHVHVGVDSGEHAIAIMNSISVFLPHILALSSSSPFWGGIDSGLSSSRSKIFEGLPTAGIPPHIRNWSQFVALMRTLKTAEAIKSIREIWWDIRPHVGYGTVEVRVADAVATRQELEPIVAFVHCLVDYLHQAYDEGAPMPNLRDWTRKENKWRATRHGLDATIIRDERGSQAPLKGHIEKWIKNLEPTAKKLGCSESLQKLGTNLERPTSSQRQRAIVQAHGIEAVRGALMDEFSSSFGA